MPPHPHGPGMTGATHSHDVEYPDEDTWNLYSMLDRPLTTALNVTVPADAVGVFKPFVRRLDELPRLISDADEEIIVVARFTAPVHVRRIMIIGGDDASRHPSQLKCYVNQENVDFSSIQALTPAQEFALSLNEAGTVEILAQIRPFTNITSLVFYFPANHGGAESTCIRYIGLQGEHTHYRREAVNTTYELLCTGQDVDHKHEEMATKSPHLH